MQKYRALHSIATVYRVAALFVSLAGVIFGTTVMVGQSTPAAGLGVLVGALLLALTMQAFAELIQLFLNMADDMRATADYFRRHEK